MRLLAVTHGPLVGPELFADVLAEDGHELREWEIVRSGAPPGDGYDAVLVFGGKQNVGEERDYPWLHDEYTAIKRWTEDGTPLLGVCLGAQTLAHALGAPVTRVEQPLAGFYETTLTEAGAADPLLGVLPRSFDALNANGYTFAIPVGATELARGPVNQAFRFGNAWGVQFHPEVRRDQALAWFAAEGRSLPKPLAELERDLDAKLPAWQELGRSLCRAFVERAGASA
ncbi:MAG TPA: type 1 glutamine amidotransferase [Gaiellaceae bacterium]